MTRFDEVKRLKELEAKATGSEAPDEAWCEYSHDLRSAAPWLLHVAEAFRPGDATILRLFAEFLEHFKPDGHLNDEGDGAGITNARAADCLRRLQAAAEGMER